MKAMPLTCEAGFWSGMVQKERYSPHFPTFLPLSGECHDEALDLWSCRVSCGMLLVIKNSSGFRLKPGCDLSGRLAATFLSGVRVADNYRVASCGCTMIYHDTPPKNECWSNQSLGFSITVSHKSHSALVNFRHVSSSPLLIVGLLPW